MPLNITLNFPPLIEFSNGCDNNSVTIYLATNKFPPLPKFEIWTNNKTQFQSDSSKISLVDDIWQHLAATYDGLEMKIYLNAILLKTSQNISYEMPTLVRTNNFIGGTKCLNEGHSSSYVDDVRIYSTCLSQSQINDVMMSNETNFSSTSNII